MHPSAPATRSVAAGPSVALLVTLLVALGMAAPAETAEVQYRYKSFVLLDAPPALNQLNGYQPRLFDDQLAQSRAITATVGDDSYACPLAFQDAVRVSGNGTESTAALMGYAGCPFELDFLATEGWVRLREPVTIEVDRIRDGVVYVTPNSNVPFVAAPQQLPIATPTAVGVTWRFRRAGLRFSTPAGEFVTAREDATVSFTAEGPRFSGFSGVPRQAGVVPTSNGWAREAMQSVQQRLAQLGHDPGPVDGVWGKRTRDALVAFQRASGLDASGTLDSLTLDELGI